MERLYNHKWFEYDLMNAWGTSFACVTVLNAEKNTVCFSVCDDSCNAEPYYIPSSIHTVEIDDQSLNDIIEVVKDKNLYLIDNLRINNTCIDGYMHRFYFSDGVNQIELSGSNLFLCINHISDYPNVKRVVNALEKIKNILVCEGIDRRCFSLMWAH